MAGIEDDAFDYYAGFVQPDLIIYTTNERDEIFLIRYPELDGLEIVAIPGRQANDLVVTMPGGLLVSNWLTGQASTWTLA